MALLAGRRVRAVGATVLAAASITGAIVASGSAAGAAPPPRPTLTTVVPGSGYAGTVVTLDGRYLAGTTTVRFGTKAAKFVVKSTGVVTATAPPGRGTEGVTVTTTGGTTGSRNFTYIAPVVTKLAPSTGLAGTTVTLTGSGFTPTATVTFGGTRPSHVTITKPTRITVVVPPHGPGSPTVGVVVDTTSGTSGKPAVFTYTVPVVTKLAPTPAFAGTTVTLTGSGFTSTASVYFGGTALKGAKVLSPSSITFTVPPRGPLPATVAVTVVTSSGVSAPASFTYDPVAITSVTPSFGLPHTSATITGYGYTATATLTFGGTTLTTAKVKTSGRITFTIPARGTHPVADAVQVKDRAGTSNTVTFTYNVPKITTTGVPNATAGSSYSQPLAVTGGTSTDSWSSTGALPPGLVLSATGTISGLPTGTGTFPFSVTVTDGSGTSVSQSLSITSYPPLSITTASLPSTTQGKVYPATTLKASGGTGVVKTWTASGLPSGLSISATTGTISGTPAVTGTFHVVVTVQDAASGSAGKVLSMTVYPRLAVTTTGLPAITAGGSYLASLAATGGTGTYHWRTIVLPGGLSFSPTGTISGIPTTAGTYMVKVFVTDAHAATATATVPIKIYPKLSISVPSLPKASEGQPYPATTFSATGGTGSNTWSASGLPSGLTITAHTGTVSGTPTTTGTFSVTIKVADSSGGSTSVSVSMPVKIALAVTTVRLPSGTVGHTYLEHLSASGGTGSYLWYTIGDLPPGLALLPFTLTNIDIPFPGTVFGIPTKAGTYTFKAAFEDYSGTTATGTVTITIYTPLTMTTTTSLATSTEGVPYPAATFRATGGTGSDTWSATGLPAGLTITTHSGTVSGTPTATGTFTVTVKVTDNLGTSATRHLSLTLYPQLKITTTALPSGTVGGTYFEDLSATGGTGGYFWYTTGDFPSGLALFPLTPSNPTIPYPGIVFGSPTTPGTFTFKVHVSDYSGAVVTRTVSITIYGPLAITTSTSLATSTADKAYPATTFHAAGGTGSDTWSATGLPAGLTITDHSGTVSGTPTAFGRFSVTVTVGDASDGSVSRSLVLTIIGAPPAISPTTGKAGTSVTITVPGNYPTIAVTIGGAACLGITESPFTDPFLTYTLSGGPGSTKFTCTVPPGGGSTANGGGPEPVVVTTGHGSTFPTGTFTYKRTPSITSISPNPGPGGGPVTLYGSGLKSATNIYVGPTFLFAFNTAGSTSSLKFTMPAGSGTVSVSVRAFQPTFTYLYSNSITFTYDSLPHVVIRHHTVFGGTTETIIGTGLTRTASVKFGGCTGPDDPHAGIDAAGQPDPELRDSLAGLSHREPNGGDSHRHHPVRDGFWDRHIHTVPNDQRAHSAGA